MMLKYTDLHNYQVQAKNFALENPKSGLFLSLGAGKTIITLSTLSECNNGTVLLLGPLRVMKTVWMQEGKNWEHTQGLKFNQLAGLKPKERLKRLANGAGKINLLNIELLQWLMDNLYEWPFDTVIVDEFSMFKNPSTKRFKLAKKYFRLSKRVMGLTGTPTPNTLLNLWSQLFLLDSGERLEKTYSKYKLKYFHQTDFQGYVWALNEGADKIIYDKVSDICMSLNAGDFIDLPDVVYNDVTVYLEKAERSTYERLRQDEIIHFLETQQTVTAVNAAVLANKLIQLASGTIYDEDGETVNVHDRKLEAFEDMIEELAGQAVLVAYRFKSDLAKLKAAYPNVPVMGKIKYNGMSDEDLCVAWNNKELPMMFVSPAADSHGLNLQYGGNNIIEYTPDWSWERTEQLYGRLARQNQQHPQVFVHRLLTHDTFDQKVIAKLKTKAKGQNALLEAVKMEIESDQTETES